MAARHTAGLHTATAIPGLAIWSASEPGGAHPAIFEPRFYMLLQGEKRLVIGGAVHHLGGGSFAVASIGLPFTSQVTVATSDRPYIGIDLAIDPDLVARMVPAGPPQPGSETPAFAPAMATTELIEPLSRLLGLLDTPADIAVLAPLHSGELFYRLAAGPAGPALRRALWSDTQYARIRQAVDWIRSRADQPLRVDDLASRSGMSLTSFHRHFKAATGTSPLAYQRHVRLLEARRKLISGHAVTAVAFSSGYASPSQFSREYKRMFGVPPGQDTHRATPANDTAAPTVSGNGARRRPASHPAAPSAVSAAE